MVRPKVYPDELRERAVLLHEWRQARGVTEGGYTAVAKKLGLQRETLRRWVLEREIARKVTLVAPTLLALHGCGALSAAKIVGEAAGASRFGSSPGGFRPLGSTAPIPVWSGSTNFRPNRGGNRQVKAALHRIGLHRPGMEELDSYVNSNCPRRRQDRGHANASAAPLTRFSRRLLTDEHTELQLLDRDLKAAA